jgi:hypothetical protein
MKDSRFGNPVGGQPMHPLPREAILLATPPQRAQPNTLLVIVECFQRSSVGRHCVVGEEASDDLLDPSIAACNGMASAGCRRSKAIKPKNRSLQRTRLATSISTLPRCKRKTASCICLLPSIARQSSPMPSFTPQARRHGSLLDNPF